MSTPEKKKPQRLEELRAEIRRHDGFYYRHALPEISDQAYDQKLELEKLEADLDPLGLLQKQIKEKNWMSNLMWVTIA